MQSPWRHLIPALALCCALPAIAAREFTPQAGLWMIPSENNGQPGRGFSLDVQGNTAFLQVFNYEKSGAATFHTAVGQLDDAAAMTVPLLRFKGGRFLGGPAQDAVEDGTAGNVTVKFTDGLNGTVQFPGESEQAIARFLVNEKQPFWWTQLSDDPPSGKEGSRLMRWTATTQSGTRYVWIATLGTDAGGVFPLGLESPFDWGSAVRRFDCRMQAATQVFDCLPTANSTNPEAPNLPLEAQRLRFRVVGRDVVGEIQPAWDPAQRMTLTGWNDGSFSCNASWCNDASVRSARIYASFRPFEDVCITGYCTGYGYGHITLLPSSGAWMIVDENTGRPGRGVFLDVQEDSVIVQTSDYLESGEPTFHMGAGTLKSSKSISEDTTSSFPLVRYAGGRFFGGPAQSGKEVVDAGSLQLAISSEFPSNTLTDFASGRITLPGEATQSIHRLSLEPAAATGIDHMLGEYWVEWQMEQPMRREMHWLRLSKVDGLIAKNDDGTIQCRQRDATYRYRMTCFWNDKPNVALDNMFDLKGYVDVDVNPFNRSGGNDSPSLLYTRDRHGNWLGLGAVKLPGLAIPAQ